MIWGKREMRDTQDKLKMRKERAGNKFNRKKCSHITSSEMSC